MCILCSFNNDLSNDEYVQKRMKYVNAKKNKQKKGYHKTYLNKLREVGCSKGHCSMCHKSPYNKSIKKTKGNHKMLHKTTKDIINEYKY